MNIPVQSDMIVIDDYVDIRCIRHVHVMSNREFAGAQVPFPLERGAVTREGGVWHYRAEYPYRGALNVACVDGGRNFRRLVVWSLDGYGSVQAALDDAMVEYSRLFQGVPGYAFMRRLPRNVENGHEAGLMMLFEAEWMLQLSIAVGGKG